MRRLAPPAIGLAVLAAAACHDEPTAVAPALEVGSQAALEQAAGPACTPPPAGMVRWFPGDGSAAEMIRGLDGTIYGSGVSFPTSTAAGAFRFDGSNSGIRASDVGLPVGSAPFTVEFWDFQPQDNGGFPNRVSFFYGSAGAGAGGARPNVYMIHYMSGAQIGDWGGGPLQVGTAQDLVGGWHHLALTFDGKGAWQLYVDGAPDVSVNKPQATLLNGTLNIGNSGSGEPFRGQIDELSIYSRALEVSEIQAIASAGPRSKCNYATTTTLAVTPATRDPKQQVTLTAHVANATDPAIKPFRGTVTFTDATTGTTIGSQEVDATGRATLVWSNPADRHTITATYSGALRFGASTGSEEVGCAPVPDGMLRWFRAEGNANEFFGKHGTGAVPYAVGMVGQAFNFNGSSAGISAPDGGLPAGSAPFTVEFWGFQPQDNGGTPRVSYFFGTRGSPVNVYMIHYVRGALIGHWGGGPLQVGTSKDLVDGAWHHLAVTFDGSTSWQLYVDGVPDVRVAKPQSTRLNGTLYIGNSGAGEQFYGQIDEFSMYDRALDSSEVRRIYQAGSAGKCGINRPPVANAGGPYTAAESAPITLDASASADPDGDALTHDWYFGDGVSGTGNTPTHVYVDNGTYQVKLNVTDDEGLRGTAASATVTVTNVPPSVTTEPADIAPLGEPFQFSASFSDLGAADAPWSYVIDWGDGHNSRGTVEAQGSITASHSYTSAPERPYDVRLSVTDKDGGEGSAVQQVTVNPALAVPGDSVTAEPVDPAPVPGAQPVALTFDEVMGGGTATLETSDTPPINTDEIAKTYHIDSSAVFYLLNTSASYSGTVTVCIRNYSVPPEATVEQVVLLHGESDGNWEPLPTTQTLQEDGVLYTICGQTSSLSPFVIARKKLAQQITFAAIGIQYVDARSLQLSASTNALGLTVSLALDETSSPSCTLSGTTITFTDVTAGPAAPCVVVATQAGNDQYAAATPVRQSFEVRYRYSGFFQPVDNNGVLNRVSAGRAIPVKFSLGGDQGSGILKAGSPTVISLACPNAAESLIETTVEATSNSLTYDAATGQYVYVWKTNSTWVNSCRRFVLTFKDGSSHEALFHFVR